MAYFQDKKRTVRIWQPSRVLILQVSLLANATWMLISVCISADTDYGKCNLVVPCVVPVGKVLRMLFREGRSSNLRPHTLAIIPATSVLEFIVHKQWVMLVQVNCVEFKSRYLGFFITTNTHWSSSLIQGGSNMTGTDFFFVTIIAHLSSNSQTGLNRF